MLILQIDASSDLCSVALARNGVLLDVQINTESFQHGRDINILIEAVLKKCRCGIADIEAVSVNKGPGSYTALRIGMATAKGLCYGLDIPLLTPTGFEVLIDYAMKKHPEAEYYVPMIDARRMEVYTVEPIPNLEHTLNNHAMVLDEQSFSEWSEHRVCFVGNGVSKWQSMWPDVMPWIGEPVEIDAGKMCGISHQFLQRNNISDVFTAVPLYIKKPHITRSKKEYFN